MTHPGYASGDLSDHPFGPYVTPSDFVNSERGTDISPPRLVGVCVIKKRVSVPLPG